MGMTYLSFPRPWPSFGYRPVLCLIAPRPIVCRLASHLLQESPEDIKALWRQVLDSPRHGVRRGAPWGRHGQRPCATTSPTRGLAQAVQQSPYVPGTPCSFATFLVLAVREFKRVANSEGATSGRQGSLGRLQAQASREKGAQNISEKPP